MDNDLYNILELKTDATIENIKKNFKRLALKYHPYKNKEKDSNEKFNQIRVAYEILSDKDKKEKYDNMMFPKKKHFIDTIFLFLKEITNPKIIHELMNKLDIVDDIKKGNINLISQKIIQKILDDIDTDIKFDVSRLSEIFINSPSTKPSNVKDNNIKSINSYDTNSYEVSELNTLDIIGTIKTNLDDIYHNRLKEVTIKNKVYHDNKITTETNNYYVPLYDGQVTIVDAGDKVMKNKSDIEKVGNVILKILCKKDKIFKRDNYNIIYRDNITLHELFYGFNKNINYFNEQINISSNYPFQEYRFDGDKIDIIIKNKGLPYDQDNNRGDLIIYLYLNRDQNFEGKIKNIL
jgi:DnaJ-class molecular chaperone